MGTSSVWTDERYATFVKQYGPEMGWQSRRLWQDFQSEFGMECGWNAFRQFATRMRDGGKIVPPATQRVLTDEIMQIKCERLLVTSDHHVPAHDADWLEFAMEMGALFECGGHAMNGDLGNFKSVASFDNQIHDNEESLEETLRIMDEIIFASAKRFGMNWLDLGNHEHWLVRRLLQAKLAPERLKKFLTDSPNVELTEFSYMIANRDLAQGRAGVRITHPRNFSRVPTSVGRQLASKFLQHVIVGHDHLVGMSRDPSGHFTVCHSGCMADPRRFDYIQSVDSTMPVMAQGFAIVDGNYIYHFDRTNTDMERWRWMAKKGRSVPRA